MSNRVFISYSNEHPVYAKLIRNRLINANFSTWWDKDDLVDGKLWEENIINAIISDCFALIVIVTKDAIEKQWVKKEVSTAFNNKKIIIPIIMEGGLDVRLSLQKLCNGLEEIQAFRFDQGGFDETIGNLINHLNQEADTWRKLQAQIEQLNHWSIKARANALQNLAVSNNDRVIEPIVRAMGWEVEFSHKVNFYVPALAHFRHFPDVYNILFSFLLHWPTDMFATPAYNVMTVCEALGICGKTKSDEHLDTFFDYFSLISINDQMRILQAMVTPHNHKEVIDLAFNILVSFLNDDERRIRAIHILSISNKRKEVPQYILPYLLLNDTNVHDAIERALTALKYPGLIPREKKPR